LIICFLGLAIGITAVSFIIPRNDNNYKKNLSKYQHVNTLEVIVIALIQWGKDKQTIERICLYALSMLCFIIGFLYGEWGTVILPFIFIEYFFRDKKIIRFLGYALIEVFAILLPFGEPFYFLVFPFILLYSGERGPKTNFSKYFFYIFYPVHLWIIAIINFMVIV
ncbi:MAG: hypothetical protein HDQ97_18675, partial [Lachnospiraceae bacterium]|nr:hypothetical protein [Lachnospiraceae bacterium]